MRTAALIVAAGRGTRLGGDLPKQYLDLCGRSVLRRTVERFCEVPEVTAVLPVIAAGDRPHFDAVIETYPPAQLLPPATGGATRAASVRAGLEALAADPPDRVLVHDAARPFPSRSLIGRVIDALDTAEAVLPARPVVDALWRTADDRADVPVARDGLWRAQTPQGFVFAALRSAHQTATGTEADDVAVARAAGLSVRVVEGEEQNFKITDQADLERARRHLEPKMDVRTGNGYDVHALGPGDGVVLCGVRIPFESALIGHSDADVAMHAITDALFGALGEGDIGAWFPPSEARWKGADSRLFLDHAVARCAERGFAIGHVDCTIVCEAPKIGPHSGAMRAKLSEILGIGPDRISVKATTSERLGFTGRGEGIAALATATLVAR